MPRLTKVHSAYNSGEAYMFECPGCGCSHMVAVGYGPEYLERHGGKPGAQWKYNGNIERPTFEPSLLVREYDGDKVVRICHSFIKNGQIQFLSDCTHAMANLTVNLDEVDDV